jgi:hypothetical protein
MGGIRMARLPRKVEEAKNRRDARKKRGGTGKLRRKLSYPEREGYHRHWINDQKRKVQDCLDRGYMFVEKEEGKHPGDPDVTNEMGQSLDSRVSTLVGTKEDGTPLRAFLMEIPQEWYDEDRKEMYEQIDAVEKAIEQGEDQYGRPGKDGRYIPRSGGTKIQYG